MLIEKLGDITEDIVLSKKLFERSEPKKRMRISGIGKDIMWCYMEIKKPIEPEEKLKRIFDMGHMVEQYLFARLEKHIHNKDKVVKTNIVDLNGELVTGELDCMYKDEHGIEYIVDVKSMSSRSFTKLVEEQDIHKSHFQYYCQLQLYMHFEGIEDAFILAYNKDNSELAEVFCIYDREFTLYLLSKFDLLRWHLDEQKVPELEFASEVVVKTTKVRNKDEYKGTGQIIRKPHKLNYYNPYIETEWQYEDKPETKGVIYDVREPHFIED